MAIIYTAVEKENVSSMEQLGWKVVSNKMGWVQMKKEVENE
jgi:hypothetical protein